MRCLCMIKLIILDDIQRSFSNKNSFVYKPKDFGMLQLNDHVYLQIMCLFVGSKFLGSHRRLLTPSNIFIGSHRWGSCLTTTNESFTRGGVYPCLLLPNTYFLLPFHITVRLYWTLSHLTKLTKSNTKRCVDLKLCTHTHSMRCTHAYAMQCVIACYIMSHV